MRKDDAGQTFGAYLARAIEEAGFATPTQFARAVPTRSGKGTLDPSSVLRWITGDAKPTLPSLEAIAPILQVDVNELVARAYGARATAGDASATPAPTPRIHDLARDIDRLLSPSSRMSDAERQALEAVITGAIAPYRRYLRSRRPA